MREKTQDDCVASDCVNFEHIFEEDLSPHSQKVLLAGLFEYSSFSRFSFQLSS